MYEGLEAPAGTWSKELVFLSETYDPDDPDQAAFLLVREVSVWFGHSEEAVPYTKNAGDVRVIDADEIASIR